MTAIETDDPLGDSCEMRECKEKGHCWHQFSIDLSKTTGVLVMRCCFCGGRTNLKTRSDPYHDLREHGRYAP